MSCDLYLYINGKPEGILFTDNVDRYIKENYPNGSFEIKDGSRVMVTIKVPTAYERLVNDLKEANQKAMEAIEGKKDGGSANLDSVFLRLKGWRESKVLSAIKEVGLYCRAKRRWIGEGYMINPTSGGQGYRREMAVTVMCKELEERGWDVIAFRQMD